MMEAQKLVPTLNVYITCCCTLNVKCEQYPDESNKDVVKDKLIILYSKLDYLVILQVLSYLKISKILFIFNVRIGNKILKIIFF